MVLTAEPATVGARKTTEFGASEYAAPLAMAAAPGSNIRWSDVSRAVSWSNPIGARVEVGSGAPRPGDVGAGRWWVAAGPLAEVVAARWTAGAKDGPDEVGGDAGVCADPPADCPPRSGAIMVAGWEYPVPPPVAWSRPAAYVLGVHCGSTVSGVTDDAVCAPGVSDPER